MGCARLRCIRRSKFGPALAGVLACHMHSKAGAANVHLNSSGKIGTSDCERAHKEPLNPVNSQSGRVKTSISARRGSSFAYLTAPRGIFLETNPAPQTPLFPFHVSFHKWDVQAEGCGQSAGCVEGGPGIRNVEQYKSVVSLTHHFN